MKKKYKIILLGLFSITLMSFDVNELNQQEVELTTFLNGRANPDFLKYTKNVQTTLPKGTTGKVTEVRKFASGNAGVKITVNGGPKAGQSYWVYYDKKNSAIKLTDNKSKKEVVPEKAVIKETTAIAKRDVPAKRDLEEQALVEIAKEAGRDLNAKAINEGTSIQTGINCNKDAEVPAKAPKEAAKEAPRDPNALLTPQSALDDLNSEELKFVGRDIMPGSGQNRSCIFQNSKVVVIYDNCMGSKKEAPVTDFKIVSKTGGEVSFYVENASDGAVSKMKRSQYDSTWKVSYSETKAPAANSVQGVKKYLEDNENNNSYCYVGASFGAKKSAEGVCSEAAKGDKSKWINEAESFWANPSESWYVAQTKLRQLVQKAPY